MSPQAQQIAIANACGWADVRAYPMPLPPESEDSQLIIVAGRHVDFGYVHSAPDYLSDLNAMHEAEKVLDALHRGLYRDTLVDISADSYACFATAAQRAEAFLRTLNLWDASK